MTVVVLDFTALPDTVVMPAIGYVFLMLSAVAVGLFCWLGFASATNPRRDK